MPTMPKPRKHARDLNRAESIQRPATAAANEHGRNKRLRAMAALLDRDAAAEDQAGVELPRRPDPGGADCASTSSPVPPDASL
jgi:hypothetical protein